jgi:hypothetical protein
VQQQYTERELKIIAEAIVDEFITTSLVLEAKKQPPAFTSEDDEVIITDRGRGLLGTFLMTASGLIAVIPLVGWILAPILVLLAKMGVLEDYVADYIQGKANIESVITRIENIILGIVSKVPNSAIKPIAVRVKRRVADESGRKAIDIYVSNRTSNEAEKNNLLTAIYLTDVVLEMLQKNIRLPKTMGKKAKIKLPTDNSGQGLIVINPTTLPSPYNFLHGIQGEIEAEVIDKADPAGREAADKFDHPQTDHADVVDITPAYPELPDHGTQDPKLIGHDPLAMWDEEDDDSIPPGMEESYLQQLDDELKVLAMINEIKYARR